jgi:hypothetical protein
MSLDPAREETCFSRYSQVREPDRSWQLGGEFFECFTVGKGYVKNYYLYIPWTGTYRSREVQGGTNRIWRIRDSCWPQHAGGDNSGRNHTLSLVVDINDVDPFPALRLRQSLFRKSRLSYSYCFVTFFDDIEFGGRLQRAVWREFYSRLFHQLSLEVGVCIAVAWRRSFRFLSLLCRCLPDIFRSFVIHHPISPLYSSG